MSENPFHFNNPTPPEDFLGRRQSVDKIVNDLCSWYGDSYGIVGGRRFGKSSLLRAIQNALVKRLEKPNDSNICVIPVYMSLKGQHTINLPGDVFGFALHRIRGATSGTKKPPAVVGSIELTSATKIPFVGKDKTSANRRRGPVIELGLPEYIQTDPLPISLHVLEAAMEEILDAAYKVVGTLRIVLLIDEIESVMEFSWAGELFGNLRSLVYDSDIRDCMRLVLAGSEHYLDVDEKGSRLFNALKTTFLEAFNSDSVKELVGRADGLDPVVAQEVIRQGGGHPFIIQHILHYLVETGLRSATLDHVKAEVQHFRLARRADLDGWLDAIGEEGRRVYSILRQSTDWMTFAEVMKEANDPRLRVDRGLTALTYHGLIIHDGAYQNFRIHGELFRDWFDERYQPSEYYTCFLCYSSKDLDIANRLYDDLRCKGVRCWSASHHLRPGTPILRGIEEAILLHEKLLLILSDHAVNSSWVMQEVEAALSKEATSGQEILFPIRLDNTVLESDTLWAKRLRQRHIGNFTNWQDDTAYKRAFTTLLRHLKVVKPPTP